MSNLILKSEEREQIEEMLSTSPIAIQRRARLLLLYAEGFPTQAASHQAGYSSSRARYWKRQFSIRGMEIFQKRTQENHAEESRDNIKELTVPSSPSQPGILPDDLMCEAGRKILHFHYLEMLKHEAGTIAGEDIEELHDMRVATRRLRAAFSIFGGFFAAKTIRPFLQGLKTTGRMLGEVRDLDVSMEKVRTFLNHLPAEQQTGLDPLLDNWNSTLEQSRMGLLSHLNSQEYLDFKSNFSVFLQTPGMGLIKTKRGAPMQTTTRFLAPTLIYTRLASVMAFDSILTTASYAQLHALRIEFKKFRYTLEFFREVLGAESQVIINEIKKLQDHLGELNDANVACQTITRFLKKWDKSQIVFPLQERLSPEPVVNYLAYRYAERYQLMITFSEKWQQFTNTELRQSLAKAIGSL